MATVTITIEDTTPGHVDALIHFEPDIGDWEAEGVEITTAQKLALAMIHDTFGSDALPRRKDPLDYV